MMNCAMQEDLNLENYSLDFRPRNNEFYNEFLGSFTNREASELLDFKTISICKNQASNALKIKGKLKVLRFLKMCEKLNRKPCEIISKYQPKLIEYKRQDGMIALAEVSDNILKSPVYQKMCDLL